MKTWRMQYYNRFRAQGYGASLSWEMAKTLDRFENEQNRGRVRITADGEEENYFDVYGEPEGGAKERAELERLIERDGCWYVHADRSCPECGSWETVDGVGMYIGNHPTDAFENPYVVDMMGAALDALGEGAK